MPDDRPAPAGQGYPDGAAARNRFVLAHRPARTRLDPWRHQGVFVEDERDADGRPAPVATVLLTGRECPWRCAMCDLWRYTTTEDTPRGSIPEQIASAFGELRRAQRPFTAVKLYNAGSFFDPRAVPESDYDAIARHLDGLSRVVVESHPALIGDRVDRLSDALGRLAGSPPPSLEVAMGLETAHPGALEGLNKGFDLPAFTRAAGELARRDVALRVFLLISPPFVPAPMQDDWLLRSVDAAIACGASVVSLVPTRAGNGTIERLANESLFTAPRLDDVERSFALALSHAAGRARVFVDLWDLERFGHCPCCVGVRRDRLHRMNLRQTVLPAIACERDDCAARAAGERSR